MNEQGLLILGSAFEYLFVAVWVLAIVGNWVSKQVKESKQKQNIKERMLSNSDSAPASLGGDTSMTATQLAKKRRSQLQKLTQQRQARIQRQQPGGSSQSHDHPSNLTPAEAVSREAEKTEYDRRAEALRKQAEQHRQQRERQREMARQRAEQQLRKQQSQSRRQSQSAVRTQQQQRQVAASKSKLVQPKPQRTSSRPPQPQQKSRRVKLQPIETPQAEQVENKKVSRRIVPDASVSYANASKAPSKILVSLLSSQSIRSAVIWKEILDKPLAMREQDPFGI